MKKTSDSEKVVEAVQSLLQPFLMPVESVSSPQTLRPLRVVVGLSGGRDSMVLLEAWHRWCLSLPEPLQQSFKAQTLVIHINHQLQSESEQWSGFCAQQCAQRGLPFEIVRVQVCPHIRQAKGEEQAARVARYQALSQFLRAGDVLLTAHHQRDQAETFLLNLMRGAGVAGLQGMPLQKALGEGWHLRPLLSLSAEQIVAASEQWDLAWIEDPSNAQSDYRRNFLRHHIFPPLQHTWPAATSKISQSAEWMQEAQSCLEDLAQLDLSRCAHFSLSEAQAVPPFSYPFSMLDLTALDVLTRARQKNLLRFWLHEVLGTSPSQRVIEWVLQESQLHSSADRHPVFELKAQQWRLEISAQALYVYALRSSTQDDMQTQTLRLSDLKRDPRFQFTVKEAESSLNPVLMTYQQAKTEKAFQLSKRYKKWFQKHDIPTWQRANWPGFWWENQFVLCGMAQNETPSTIRQWPFEWAFFEQLKLASRG